MKVFEKAVGWVVVRLWVLMTCPAESPWLNLSGTCDRPRWHDGDHSCAGRVWPSDTPREDA